MDGHSPRGRLGLPKIDDVTRSSLKQTIKIVVSLAPLFAFWFIALGHRWCGCRSAYIPALPC